MRACLGLANGNVLAKGRAAARSKTGSGSGRYSSQVSQREGEFVHPIASIAGVMSETFEGHAIRHGETQDAGESLAQKDQHDSGAKSTDYHRGHLSDLHRVQRFFRGQPEGVTLGST